MFSRDIGGSGIARLVSLLVGHIFNQNTCGSACAHDGMEYLHLHILPDDNSTCRQLYVLHDVGRGATGI